MSGSPILRMSANTGSSVALPLLLSTGIAFFLLTSPSPSLPAVEASRPLDVLSQPGAQESVTKLQWQEFLQRAESDDIERELAPIIPSVKIRHATIHLVRRGRGIPIA